MTVFGHEVFFIVRGENAKTLRLRRLRCRGTSCNGTGSVIPSNHDRVIIWRVRSRFGTPMRIMFVAARIDRGIARLPPYEFGVSIDFPRP